MSKILKSYQINFGLPFEIKPPLGYRTIKRVDISTINGLESGLSEDTINDMPLQDPQMLIDEAAEQAQLIIGEAQLEAEKIMEQAREQAENEKVFVFEQAQRLGIEEGLRQANEQFEELIKEAEATNARAKSDYYAMIESMEQEILELSIRIAKKVIGVELEQNKQAIISLIRQAVQKCPDSDTITLRVPSDSYEQVQEQKEEIMSIKEGLDSLEVKRDVSLKPGSCIIDTPNGSIDAGVDTQLGYIEEAIMECSERGADDTEHF